MAQAKEEAGLATSTHTESQRLNLGLFILHGSAWTCANDTADAGSDRSIVAPGAYMSPYPKRSPAAKKIQQIQHNPPQHNCVAAQGCALYWAVNLIKVMHLSQSLAVQFYAYLLRSKKRAKHSQTLSPHLVMPMWSFGLQKASVGSTHIHASYIVAESLSEPMKMAWAQEGG